MGRGPCALSGAGMAVPELGLASVPAPGALPSPLCSPLKVQQAQETCSPGNIWVLFVPEPMGARGAPAPPDLRLFPEPEPKSLGESPTLNPLV